MADRGFAEEHPYIDCPPCTDYFTRRHTVIVPAVVALVDGHPRRALDLIHRYRKSVHARHLAGLSLETP